MDIDLVWEVWEPANVPNGAWPAASSLLCSARLSCTLSVKELYGFKLLLICSSIGYILTEI